MPIGANSYERSILPNSHWRALYRANVILLDMLMDDLQQLGGGTSFSDLAIVNYLPRRFLPKYDEGFLRSFLVCATSVGLKLRLSGWHALGCVGEELAYVAMRALAEEILDEEGLRHVDYGGWEDTALEDLDVELLFDAGLDGIEDPEGDVARHAGFANLDFQSWFKPFNPPRTAHPFVTNGIEKPWNLDHSHYDPKGSHRLLEKTGYWGGTPPPRTGTDRALALLGLEATECDYLSCYEDVDGHQWYFFWSHVNGQAVLFHGGSTEIMPVIDGDAPNVFLSEPGRQWIALCWRASAVKRHRLIQQQVERASRGKDEV